MFSFDKGGRGMVPQIFISSTFYDLKYAREELGNFVKNYGFAPILFENGDVGYEPGEDLDFSCYKTMAASDMAIIIIGGRYGSAASGENENADKFEKYLSVTRKEFEAAVENNTPVYVFIEGPVDSEYWLYKKNKDKIEDGSIKLEFNAADSVNVFRFIENIRIFKTIPITSFSEIGDIKSFLQKQWANMFKSYLIERKNSKPIKDITPSINGIYRTIQSMEVMLQNIGEKVIGDNPSELKNIYDEQKVENVAGIISDTFEFICKKYSSKKVKTYLSFFVKKLYEAKKEGILDYSFSDNIDDITEFQDFFSYEDIIITRVKNYLQLDDSNVDDELMQKISSRLCENDYLIKMKFIN